MDLFSSLKEKYLPLLKLHWLPLMLGIVGISLIGYGLIQSLVTKRDSSEITFQSSGQSAVLTDTAKSTASKAKEIVVDVEGAVLKPGIHTLPPDSRVQDALAEAGGLSEKADHVKVSQGMNLAARVVDGGKIYIPFDGESAPVTSGEVAGFSTGGMTQTSGLININSASEKELDTLSGVGPATAQKIISNRPYSSVEELLNKKAVGKSVFSKIKDKVTI